MILVGLPDTALREARDRIRSAIINSGEQWPQRRITVGLSPASLPKRGSGFDLPIACALLAAAGVLQAAVLAGTMFLGELGLDGQLRPVRGCAARHGGRGRGGLPLCRGGPRPTPRRPHSCPASAWCPRLRSPRCWPGCAASLRPGERPSRSSGGRAPAAPPAAPQGLARTSSAPHRICPTCSASRSPGGRPRSARPAVTTCPCSGRPVRARRCWPSGCPRFCPGSTRRRPWRSPRSTRSRARCPGTAPAGQPAVLRAAPHRQQGGHRGRRQRDHHPGAASLAHRGCCSWTRHRSSAGTCWTRCASRSNRARW